MKPIPNSITSYVRSVIADVVQLLYGAGTAAKHHLLDQISDQGPFQGQQLWPMLFCKATMMGVNTHVKKGTSHSYQVMIMAQVRSRQPTWRLLTCFSGARLRSCTEW